LSAGLSVVIFWIVQASALLVITVTFRWELAGLWAASHFLRAIGLTLAFHRYYAHRAFQMNRVARFVWTLAGTAAMQKGPLWWAGHHVYHHKYADRDGDPHSPKMSGFYHAHFGWFLNDSRYKSLHSSNPVVRAFGGAPEVVWLERFYFLPPLALALSMYAIGGWDWLIWGFCLPTMTLAHATFAINTVNHLFGSRRFQTQDDSTNNPLTALFAAGEGWHNNHHRYQRAARNGFYWWEYDITWYTIWTMEKLGLAWDVQHVPERVYQEAGSRVRRFTGSQFHGFTGAQVHGFTGSDIDDAAEPVNLRTSEPVNP
jgi:stearoyl-CoA desaturase (delta-9 desaturase)